VKLARDLSAGLLLEVYENRGPCILPKALRGRSALTMGRATNGILLFRFFDRKNIKGLN